MIDYFLGNIKLFQDSVSRIIQIVLICTHVVSAWTATPMRGCGRSSEWPWRTLWGRWSPIPPGQSPCLLMRSECCLMQSFLDIVTTFGQNAVGDSLSTIEL